MKVQLRIVKNPKCYPFFLESVEVVFLKVCHCLKAQRQILANHLVISFQYDHELFVFYIQMSVYDTSNVSGYEKKEQSSQFSMNLNNKKN